jgi:hypothetical protein
MPTLAASQGEETPAIPREVVRRALVDTCVAALRGARSERA